MTEYVYTSCAALIIAVLVLGFVFGWSGPMLILLGLLFLLFYMADYDPKYKAAVIRKLNAEAQLLEAQAEEIKDRIQRLKS